MNIVEEFYDRIRSPEYAAIYNIRRQWLREKFKNYGSTDPEGQAWLKLLVERHKNLCTTDRARRRHNCFALLYIGGLTSRNVARIQSTDQTTVWRDVAHVLDDLMMLVFDLEGMKPSHYASDPS